MSDIKYGHMTFSCSCLYMLAHSDELKSKDLAGKRVWVKELVKLYGCDWLHVVTTDDVWWYIKPSQVLPLRLHNVHDTGKYHALHN